MTSKLPYTESSMGNSLVQHLFRMGITFFVDSDTNTWQSCIRTQGAADEPHSATACESGLGE